MQIAVLFARPRTPQIEADGFEEEWLSLDYAGIESHTIDFELVVQGDVELACRHLPRKRLFVYRGFILKEEEYADLYDAIADRGGRLFVDPREYARALYVPEWYPELHDMTPATRFIDGVDLDEAWDAACDLGPPPWVVKDHVKSARDSWFAACFVPENATREHFDRVCTNLVEARGDRFERGIVIRRFVQFREIGYRTPERKVFDEHRLFFVNGELVLHAPYHDADVPPLDARPMRTIGDRIDSPFFTADIARLPNGGWMVVEVNDGGVSTLPPEIDPRDLYDAFYGQ